MRRFRSLAVSVVTAVAACVAAGGYYRDSSYYSHAFVVGETGGSWGTAQVVPGSATLNADGISEINSVSCASAC